jgi:copper chaperone CopZ
VQAALSSVPGVESAQVDFEHKTAVVVCSKGCDSKALVAALEKQGFGGTLK